MHSHLKKEGAQKPDKSRIYNLLGLSKKEAVILRKKRRSLKNIGYSKKQRDSQKEEEEEKTREKEKLEVNHGEY